MGNEIKLIAVYVGTFKMILVIMIDEFVNFDFQIDS